LLPPRELDPQLPVVFREGAESMHLMRLSRKKIALVLLMLALMGSAVASVHATDESALYEANANDAAFRDIVAGVMRLASGHGAPE
jgi:hypothetical protein